MLRRSGLLLVVLTVSSCNKSSDDDSGGGLGPRQLDSGGKQYALADVGCSDGLDAISSATISEFTHGQLTDRTASYAALSSKASLHNTRIDETYFSGTFQQKCTYQDFTEKCEDGEVTADPAPLKICRDGFAYPRTSYERIALTAIANIEHADQFYQSLSGKLHMDQATLIVLPRIEREYTVLNDDGSFKKKIVKIEADNMAYTRSSKSGASAFLLFPKGDHGVEDWPNLELWELPWGLAHEFGHFVLHTHTSFNLKDSGILDAMPFLRKSSTDIAMKDLPFEGDRTAGKTMTNSEKSFGAFNEGFADLYAFYAMGAQPGLAAGVKCFDQTRDISAATFKKGSHPNKVFDEEVWNAFYVGSRIDSESDSDDDCEIPDLSGDIHAIGAIMAFGVNKVLEASYGAATANPKLLGEKLIGYADALRPYVGSSSDLSKYAEVLLSQVAQSGVLTKAQCDAFRSVFPYFAKDLLDGSLPTYTCK